MLRSLLPAAACLLGLVLQPSFLHAHEGRHHGGLATEPAEAVRPAFDIVHTRIHVEDRVAVFHMAVSGRAGESRPSASGQLAGSTVFSYVWPTTLDPSTVGFERGAGRWPSRSPRIRISTTPRCSTRTAMAIAATTAISGTRTGWC